MDEGAKKAAILQAALAEFSALRSEIRDRSGAAWTLLNINVTATATVLGVVLSNKVDPKMLLALPLVAPALGMLFIDHAYNIGNIGNYIDGRIRPLVVEAAGSSQLLGYEAEVDQYERNRFLRFVPLGLPVTILFSGIPITTLIFVISSLDATWAWIVWSFGLVLVLTQFVLWLLFLLKPGRPDLLKKA